MPVEFSMGHYADRAPGVRTYIGQFAAAADLSRPSLMPRGTDRKAAVVHELERVSRNSMAAARPDLEALKAKGLITSYEVQPFSNTVIIDVPEGHAGDAWVQLNRIAGMGQVTRNREVHILPLEDAARGARSLYRPFKPMTLDQPSDPKAPVVEWNVTQVNAPQVWEKGFKGQGVVVGVIDTGVDMKHPALASKYRGAAADGTITNDYNWFDAIGGRAAPYDDNKHGTHVTGTVLGSTEDHAIGMAPEAKWIAAKILSGSGSGSLESVTKGLEWMLAPRDANGQNPDPTKAPDVVNNSWGTTDGKLDAFRRIWQAFVAAGIEPVAAAGNSGPRSGTLGAPGSYPESISVAAVDKNDKIASFSSRGPSPIKDASGKGNKPDIAAGGHQVTSSVPGGGYATFSGTSMATPGVTGVVALLLSKYKDLTHNEVVQAITTSAKDLGTPGYDFEYGYGRIDADAALAAADKIVAERTPAQQPQALALA